MLDASARRRSHATFQAAPVQGRRVVATSVLALAALIAPLAAGPALAADGGTARARALAGMRGVTGLAPAGQGPARDIDRGFRGGAVIDLDKLDTEGFQKLIEDLRSYVAPRTANGIPALDAARDGKYLALPLETEGKTVTLLLNMDDLYLEAWERGASSGREIFPLEAFHDKWEAYAQNANKSAPPSEKITVTKTGLPENYAKLGGLGKPEYGRYLLAQTIENLHDFKVGAGKQFVQADVVRLAVTVSEATRFKAVEKSLADKWEEGAKLPQTHQDLINEWKNITRQLNERSDKIKVTLNGKTKEVDRATVQRWMGVQHSCAIDAPGVRATAGSVEGLEIPALFKRSTANPCGPAPDETVDREKARSEAVAAGERLEKRLGERVKELCASSGEASCLGKVDWEKTRNELRADAEELVGKKLLAVENVKDITLGKDFTAALGDASGFYLPYDKTREAVSGHAEADSAHAGINASKLADTAGKAMWVQGIVQAFTADSSDLEKAAALTAMMPAVGNLMQLSADAVKQDWTHLGFDAAFVLLEGAEFLGLEAAGPAGWAVMAVQVIVDQFINFAKKDAEKAAMLDTMGTRWHDGVMHVVSDTGSKGWMANGGSRTIVQMALAMMQTIEVQRATAKGLARVIDAADASGTVPEGTDLDTKTWAAEKKFADADAKTDALATRSVAEIRKAVARSLADKLNKLWEDKATQQKFVTPFGERWAELSYDGHIDGRARKEMACQKDDRGNEGPWYDEQACAIWNFAPKPIDTAEVEKALKGMGWMDPGFMPFDTPVLLQTKGRYLTADVANKKLTHTDKAANDGTQTFAYHRDGRLTTGDGQWCMESAGRTIAEPYGAWGDVTLAACQNKDTQKWQLSDGNRFANYANGTFLAIESDLDPNEDCDGWDHICSSYLPKERVVTNDVDPGRVGRRPYENWTVLKAG